MFKTVRRLCGGAIVLLVLAGIAGLCVAAPCVRTATYTPAGGAECTISFVSPDDTPQSQADVNAAMAAFMRAMASSAMRDKVQAACGIHGHALTINVMRDSPDVDIANTDGNGVINLDMGDIDAAPTYFDGAADQTQSVARDFLAGVLAHEIDHNRTTAADNHEDPKGAKALRERGPAVDDENKVYAQIQTASVVFRTVYVQTCSNKAGGDIWGTRFTVTTQTASGSVFFRYSDLVKAKTPVLKTKVDNKYVSPVIYPLPAKTLDAIPSMQPPPQKTPACHKVYLVTSEGHLQAVDPATYEVATFFQIGGDPEVIASVWDTGMLYLLASDGLRVLDTRTGEVTLVNVGRDPVAIAFVDSKAYVLDYTDNSISVIDTRTKGVTKTILVGVGRQPYDIKIVGDKAYVSNQSDGTVSVIDTKLDEITRIIPVGSGPSAIVTCEDKVCVVDEWDNSVSLIDTTTGEVTRVSVGDRPHAIAISGAKAYVANRHGDSISVIDTSAGKVIQTIKVGIRPYAIKIFGNKAYVANLVDGTVSVIDTTIGEVTQSIPVGTNPFALAICEGRVYVGNVGDNSVSVIDTLTDTVIATVPVAGPPYLIGVGP